jgi:hypothetical protein
VEKARGKLMEKKICVGKMIASSESSSLLIIRDGTQGVTYAKPVL